MVQLIVATQYDGIVHLLKKVLINQPFGIWQRLIKLRENY